MWKKVNPLTPAMHGWRIKCNLTGVPITDARISVTTNSYFICQNVISGCYTPERFGYSYSYVVDSH